VVVESLSDRAPSAPFVANLVADCGHSLGQCGGSGCGVGMLAVWLWSVTVEAGSTRSRVRPSFQRHVEQLSEELADEGVRALDDAAPSARPCSLRCGCSLPRCGEFVEVVGEVLLRPATCLARG
jgi:hypothetical protein